MSLSSYIGAVKGNILKPSPELCKVVKLSSPILTNTEMETLRNLRYKGFKTITLPMLFEVSGGSQAMESAIASLCRDAARAVDAGYNYLIISDKRCRLSITISSVAGRGLRRPSSSSPERCAR